MTNKEFEIVKHFAESNGIAIMSIPTAFRKCWEDNSKLVDTIRELENIEYKLKQENQKLQKENEQHKDTLFDIETSKSFVL